MKTFFTSILLIALVALVLLPSNAFAQAADTVIVAAMTSAGQPGNLNTIINSDTLAGGIARHPNRVWLLKQTGTMDTTYYLTATIRMTNINLVGVTNPKTGHPPVVAPMILSDNSSVGQFITISGAGTIYCKNIYFLGTRPDGATVTGTCMTTIHDSSTFRLDHCVFENFGSTGTPNILYTQGVTYQKLFITNCLFRDNQDDTPQNPGLCWMGNWPIPMDTAIMKNNTWFINGGALIGGSPYCAYQLFEHNTVFGLTKSAVFSEKQMYNAYIRNNVFYNVNSMGMDSVHTYVTSNYNANYFGPPAVAASVVDTIINLLTNVDSTKTAKGKVIQINNNAYFWHSDLVAAWPQMSAITKSQSLGPIVQPRLCASVTGAIWWDKTNYPGVSVVNNDSLDPGFNAALVKAATDSLVIFDKLIWQNGTSGGVRPFIYLSNPTNMFAGVAANWATTQGYPVQENLRYTNTTLQTLGTDGLPVGDLNWFPEKYTGVSETQNSVPTEFALSQNYPNPFNPTTSIKVSLHQTGAMSLTIYNLLGQVVQVVDQGNKQAGEYIYNVNLERLGSGVYFYTLRQGSNSISKKMVLLK
jgi:hypothetical protein